MYKSIALGIIASFALLSLYFLIMALAQASFSEALKQLNTLRLWVVPLVISFGIQIGLYQYVKETSKKNLVGGKTTTVSSVTSTTAMIACCAHHLTDILPIIGVSVISTFLGKYQTWFLGIGILSNITGIVILTNQLKKIKNV